MGVIAHALTICSLLTDKALSSQIKFIDRIFLQNEFKSAGMEAGKKQINSNGTSHQSAISVL